MGGWRHTKGAAKEGNESTDAAVPQIQGNRGYRVPFRQPLERAHQARPMPPLGEGQTRLMGKAPAQGPRGDSCPPCPLIDRAAVRGMSKGDDAQPVGAVADLVGSLPVRHGVELLLIGIDDLAPPPFDRNTSG